MNKAPILVSVYDRPNHFRSCIESLQKNVGADETVLYISSDGPRCKRSAVKVSEVRSYIKTITGFKKIFLFAPKENSQNSVIFDAKECMLSKNKNFILSEDDNIFSPYFLNFMNYGLNFYEAHPQVLAVCGYNFPHFPQIGAPHAISLKCFSPWGWGGWRDKDVPRDFDQKEFIIDTLSEKGRFLKINKSLPHMAPMMKMIVEGNLYAGDVIQCARLFAEDRICIFPSISLVQNIGFDGSGVHCGISDRFDDQEVCVQDVFFDRLIDLDPVDFHTAWLYQFFGAKLAEIRSLMIYYELTTKYNSLKVGIRASLFLMQKLWRIGKFAQRCFKPFFSYVGGLKRTV